MPIIKGQPNHAQDLKAESDPGMQRIKRPLQIMKILLLIPMILSTAFKAKADWLPREIHEVRAYVYDYTQEDKNSSLLKQGRLHKGIINDGGTRLSKDQVARLMDAIRSSKAREPGAFCYMPHHGFVFFDKEAKAMGHIELCFQCGNVASSPKGLPNHEWNWKELKKLLEELNIPILEKDADYTARYKEKKNTREKTPPSNR